MSIAQDAFDYLNSIRSNPALAIPPLQENLKYFNGKLLKLPNHIPLQTNEGTAAVQECINFLKNSKPLPKLTQCPGLTSAAQDHAQDIGPKGICGHDGSDGSTMTDRIERYGEWNGHIGENISFGQKTGQDDDGVSTRGHRKNCFSPDYCLVGVFSAPHKQYHETTVMDFAGEFTPNTASGAPKAASKPSPVKKPQYQVQQQQQQQQQQKPKQSQGQDDFPEGCVSMNTSTETSTRNGKTTTTITKTYEFSDGSTKTTKETITKG